MKPTEEQTAAIRGYSRITVTMLLTVVFKKLGLDEPDTDVRDHFADLLEAELQAYLENVNDQVTAPPPFFDFGIAEPGVYTVQVDSVAEGDDGRVHVKGHIVDEEPPRDG